MWVHYKGQCVSRSAWHVGRETILLHLYSEEIHRAFIWPTIFLMVIAITPEIPKGWEQSYFIHSKVSWIQRCIMFSIWLRKEKNTSNSSMTFDKLKIHPNFNDVKRWKIKKVTLELLKYSIAFILSGVLVSLEVKFKLYFHRLSLLDRDITCREWEIRDRISPVISTLEREMHEY